MLEAKLPNAIADIGKWTTCFSSLKSLSHRISGQDSHKGEGCNTLGVCHQLSNGFELKHDMLSGDEGVKIKSTRVSSNLNLDNTPYFHVDPC